MRAVIGARSKDRRHFGTDPSRMPKQYFIHKNKQRSSILDCLTGSEDSCRFALFIIYAQTIQGGGREKWRLTRTHPQTDRI